MNCTGYPTKVALDLNPALLNDRTGVGFCTAGQIRALLNLYPDMQFALQYFGKAREREQARIQGFLRDGVEEERCGSMTDKCYRMLCTLLPVPYRWLFPGEAAVTHFFNYFIPPFCRGKTVVTIHDMAYRRFPKTVRWQKRWLLRLQTGGTIRRADRIVVGTEFGKNEVLRYYPMDPSRIRVVPIGVDPGKYERRPEADVQRVRESFGLPVRYFLHLGTLEPRKNLPRLIQAYGRFRAMMESRPEEAGVELPVLVLAGKKGWLYDAIFRQVRESGLEKSVLFPGYVSDEDAAALLTGAEAYLFPSLYEGFGMPLLEAMACGVPVMCAKAASLPEVAGDAALLTDPLDIEDMARAMLRLHLEPELRACLVARGRVRVAAYSWDAAAEALRDLYRELALCTD